MVSLFRNSNVPLFRVSLFRSYGFRCCSSDTWRFQVTRPRFYLLVLCSCFLLPDTTRNEEHGTMERLLTPRVTYNDNIQPGTWNLEQRNGCSTRNNGTAVPEYLKLKIDNLRSKMDNSRRSATTSPEQRYTEHGTNGGSYNPQRRNDGTAVDNPGNA